MALGSNSNSLTTSSAVRSSAIRGISRLVCAATCQVDACQHLLAAAEDNANDAGSALYFLVTPGAPVRLHRIKNDQLYHYYLGDPLETILLHRDGTIQRIIVGPDLRQGHRVQLLIPGDTFHTARLLGRRRWFLGASMEWPGVIPADVELGNFEELANQYPAAAADLREIAASVQHNAQIGVGPR